MKYDHEQIEAKWQKYWLMNETFKSTDDTSKPKYYVLDMFPYPSGSGLHVGHLVGYTATDIIARYKRAKGFNVLHPMGWDSFGLPAEQYAIRTNTHPAISTKENIDNFRQQMRLLGFSYDWSREFATSDPSYYKWTQWIFTKLYEKGLAYEAEMAVNFCPALGTVLSNEEVENGRAKEGGHLIERRPLRQWILKITAYAERLIDDLHLVDWPESLKKLQINWIGKSEGAYVNFVEESTAEAISVFTTRPDTLFGATYVVLAPEHPLVSRITTDSQRESVRAYQKQSLSKSDLDRTELNLEKTGVFTGAYAIHPITGSKVPIWIADYVLVGYGTGAIMAVPAHDERDFAFAQVYHLPIVAVYDPVDESDEVRLAVKEGRQCLSGEGVAMNSDFADLSLNGFDVQKAKTVMIEWLEKHSKGKGAITYKLRDWLFSRQRYWGEPFPLLKFDDGTVRLLGEDELPLCPPEVSNYKPTADGQSPLAQVNEWVNIVDSKTGKQASRETHTMPQWAGSCWYYLRFCDPRNEQEAWGKKAENYWMPVDLYVGGVEHAVLHLLYARFWHKVLYDCGYVHTLEPFQTLRNQGLVVAHSYQNSRHCYVEPENVEEKEGKFFDKRTGEELKKQVDKMSKSKLNGVSPDEILKEFGADALRLYEMFMGPLEKEKVWNTDAVSGCRRFLNRFYDMAFSDKITEEASEEGLKLGYRLIDGVTKDIESMQFNTAIAKLMEFMNEFTKLPAYPKDVVKMAAQALAPLAPHLAEEVWQHLGGVGSIISAPFPIAEESYLRDENVTLVVQVNGKLRGRLDIPFNHPEEAVLEAAKANSHVVGFLEGKEIVKVVFVPNKLLNIVVKP
jgi:leucyl-tRNA synthetase